jgi:hypothetical protein
MLIDSKPNELNLGEVQNILVNSKPSTAALPAKKKVTPSNLFVGELLSGFYPLMMEVM